MKEELWNKAFHMFAFVFNQGLKAARDAPSTPLAHLRAPKVNSDGEKVCYGENDNPLSKGATFLPAEPQEEGAGPKEDDDGSPGDDVGLLAGGDSVNNVDDSVINVADNVVNVDDNVVSVQDNVASIVPLGSPPVTSDE